MFRFIRTKILPLFLEREITVYKLSQMADVSYRTCQRAINGDRVSAPAISRICKALGIAQDEQINFIQEF